jgi:hypothetical protein
MFKKIQTTQCILVLLLLTVIVSIFISVIHIDFIHTIAIIIASILESIISFIFFTIFILFLFRYAIKYKDELVINNYLNVTMGISIFWISFVTIVYSALLYFGGIDFALKVSVKYTITTALFIFIMNLVDRKNSVDVDI